MSHISLCRHWSSLQPLVMVGWPIPHPFQPLSRCFPVPPGLEGWRLCFLDSLAAKVWRPVRSCALSACMWDVEDNREAQVFPSCFGCFLLVIKSLGFSAGMASVSSHQPVGVQGGGGGWWEYHHLLIPTLKLMWQIPEDSSPKLRGYGTGSSSHGWAVWRGPFESFLEAQPTLQIFP